MYLREEGKKEAAFVEYTQFCHIFYYFFLGETRRKKNNGAVARDT